MSRDPGTYAVINTSEGKIVCRLFEKDAPRPLADRLRPQKLDEVVGQDHLLKPDGPIGRMVAAHWAGSG